MSRPDPPEGLVVREANRADIPRMVGLLADGSLEERREDPTDQAPYRAAVHEIIDSLGALLVVELEGEVVGVCQLIVFRHLQARGGLCAEIESVHVRPDRRGQGIGHVLMECAVQRARDLGCYRVQLTSNKAREDAHRFYSTLGFTPSHQGFKLMLK